jgi:dCTP deaminase
MTVLSAQSIRRLCVPNYVREYISIYHHKILNRYVIDTLEKPLIAPFVERGIQNGKSFGLSSCTYDCRIAEEELILEPMPFWIVAEFLQRMSHQDFMHAEEYSEFKDRISSTNYKALASTIERFVFPANICGSVLDKSSYARVFISAFNTHLDPGWEGFLTVELINCGNTTIHYKRGDPVCQVKFEWLDEPTDLPYSGKYQNQAPNQQDTNKNK